MSAALKTNMPVITSRAIQTKIREFLAAKSAQSEAEKIQKAIKPDLLDAMAGAPTAICGPYSLDLSPRKGSTASLELKNGRKLELSEIREIVLADGTTIKAAEIVKLAGAREASEVFTVKAR